MLCGTCGATIAEKAIVCYRCGAATAIPVACKPERPPAKTPWGLVALAVVIAVVVAVAWFVWRQPG